MSLGPIELLFVDAHVVVANKPSGLLVHRGWDNHDDVAMFRVRDAIGEHVHPLHRLDRGTSGALLFARNREAAAVLARAFEEGRVEKRYVALVRGEPEPSGTIDYPIQKKEGGPRVPAITHYRRIARSPIMGDRRDPRRSPIIGALLARRSTAARSCSRCPRRGGCIRFAGISAT